jgi:nucleoside-diphosphate-sugar epimerase
VRGDNAKLWAATGWSTTIPLEDTLGDVLAWWREHV